MGGNPGNYFFFFPPGPGSFSLFGVGGRGCEGRASNRAQGRARPLYRLTLARPPFPLPFPCPLSLSLPPSLTASPLQASPRPPLPPLHAPRGPQPGAPPTTPGAGADQRAPCPTCPASATSDPGTACPRRRGLFSFCSAAPSPTGGGRPASAPPTRRLRALRAGRPCPAEPGAAPRLGTVSPEVLNLSRRRRPAGRPGFVHLTDAWSPLTPCVCPLCRFSTG